MQADALVVFPVLNHGTKEALVSDPMVKTTRAFFETES
jgi:hypothetical protein